MSAGLRRLTAVAGDGARLACWDLGPLQGTSAGAVPVLMVHGIGLHGRCWVPVAEHLRPGLGPWSADLRGHGASEPSPDGGYEWDRFGSDLLALVDQIGLGNSPGGLIGAGHSAGATALLLAEAQRPGTFSRLWLWEPIVAVPGSDLGSQRSPEFAARARRRRWHFASAAQARAHLEGRGLFADFSAEAFDAFVTGGVVPDDDGGTRLACAPEDEARAYAAAATARTWQLLGPLPAEVRLRHGGNSSAEVAAELAVLADRLRAPAPLIVPDLGHFGPFQSPALIAADISNWSA